MCNNAEITAEGLRGQPTEGALLAAAAKVMDQVCDRQKEGTDCGHWSRREGLSADTDPAGRD